MAAAAADSGFRRPSRRAWIRSPATQESPTPSSPRRYRIHRLLGRGGFGRVYQASTTDDAGEQRVVALKLVDPSRVSEAALADLRTEARIAAILDDPIAVATEAPFLLQGRWAVAMDYVDGASLFRVLREHGRIPPRPAAAIAERLLGGLHRLAHLPTERGPLGFVHRDIKPGNVQLTPFGEVRLLDFGNAWVDGLDLARSTSPDEVVGTPGFIAPERFRSIDDPRGDVYSVGVLLHRMVAGSMPDAKPPDDDSLVEVLQAAAWMRTGPLADRPDAQEAQRRLASLTETLPGPNLEDWAAAARPVPRGLAPDELVGQRLATTEHEMPIVPERTRPRTLTPSSEPVSIPATDDGPLGPALRLPPELSETGPPPVSAPPAATPTKSRMPWLAAAAVAGAAVLLALAACGLGLVGWAALGSAL